MLIKNIKLKNFRQYKNVDLAFSTDPDKNLTVILGENGYGKTTFVKAFIWCLYKENKLFTNPILLNNDVEKRMKTDEEETVSVVLDLIHGGHNYRITTTEKYKKTRGGKAIVSAKASTTMLKDASPVYSGGVELEINKILRKDVKDYFFYDGENNTIESMGKKANLKEAISQMMGIKRLEELATYFQPTLTSSVYGTLTKQLSSDDSGLFPLQEELDNATKEKRKKLGEVKKYEEQIEILEQQAREKQAIIEANKDVQDDQIRLKNLKNKVKQNQASVDSKFTSMVKQLNGKGDSFLKILFANCYSRKNLQNLEEISSFGTEESLSHISEEAIDQLIARGRCLCGAVIKDENDAYKHLIEAKSHMEPHDYGKYLSDFCTAESSNLNMSLGLQQNIEKTANDFLDYVESIEIDKEQMKEINARIEGRQDVGEIQKDYNTIMSQIQHQTGAKNYIINNVIPSCDLKIRNVNNKIAKQAEDNKKNKLIKECQKYAQVIFEQTTKRINKARTETRDTLQKEVNEIFRAMYHGDRHIEIDSSFNISTLTNNSVLDNSTGTETVKNFAFVAGLLKAIKNNVLLEGYDDEDKKSELYPLVMDAPFSDTDAEHIQNICKYLPLYCDQIFIVVMNHHFEVARDDIKSRIGKLYQINKHSETYDTIEEVSNV